MARRIVKHKQHEFTTAAGAGNYAAKEFCDRILQNPAVNKDSILVDVYPSRPAPYAPLMDDHVIIEWDEIEMQREPNKGAATKQMEKENKMDKHADVVNHPAHYELARYECIELEEETE